MHVVPMPDTMGEFYETLETSATVFQVGISHGGSCGFVQSFVRGQTGPLTGLTTVKEALGLSRVWSECIV